MIVALAGGVGGAKLAHGLAMYLPPEEVTVVVNTADDFNLYGLRICPDLDTVMYTLAGVANPETGWGIAGDTFAALEMISRYGRSTWFRIGDRDLATHVIRTSMLTQGMTLTAVTGDLCGALGVRSRVLPMSDEFVSTVLDTNDGELEFQEYFVRRRHEPEVRGVSFRGIEVARPTDAVVSALHEAELVVFCPSNPIVSIGPILSVPGMRETLEACAAPKVAVSPIVGGRALRGPADRMLDSLGHGSSALGVARLYEGLVQGFVMDAEDAAYEPDVRVLGMRVLVADTVMRDDVDRRELARRTVELGRSLVESGIGAE